MAWLQDSSSESGYFELSDTSSSSSDSSSTWGSAGSDRFGNNPSGSSDAFSVRSGSESHPIGNLDDVDSDSRFDIVSNHARLGLVQRKTFEKIVLESDNNVIYEYEFQLKVGYSKCATSEN